MQLRLMPSRRDDRGVTLIEVLMAVVLLAIIIVPLGNSLIAFLRNTDEINERLAASHDAQIAAAYFAQDVQSIGVHDWTATPYAFKTSVEQNVAPTTGTNPCGPAGTPNAVLRLAWDDPATATAVPPKIVVSYVVKVTGGERQLRRLRCDSTGTVKEIIVAHNLVSDPVATCRNAAGATQACAGPPVPQSIEMPLSIQVTGSTTNTLNVTLVGQRRQT